MLWDVCGYGLVSKSRESENDALKAAGSGVKTQRPLISSWGWNDS